MRGPYTPCVCQLCESSAAVVGPEATAVRTSLNLTLPFLIGVCARLKRRRTLQEPTDEWKQIVAKGELWKDPLFPPQQTSVRGPEKKAKQPKKASNGAFLCGCNKVRVLSRSLGRG